MPDLPTNPHPKENSMSQTPSVGRIVHILVSPSINNGSDVAPAVITRVWNDSCVNLRVLLDGSTGVADKEWATSRRLYADEQTAREAVGEAGVPSGYVGINAFWPPRQ